MSDETRLIYSEWDGLAPADRRALEAQLERDPELRRARQQAQRLRADLRALGPHGTVTTTPPLDIDRLAVTSPRSTARPLPVLAAAAAVLVGLGGWWALSVPDPVAPTPVAASPSLPAEAPSPATAEAQRRADIAVAFRLEAPAARTVAVAGDFNEWQPETFSMRQTGEGLWTARTALPPGRYAYMYVVDGQWITPPDARRTQDDGFGARNGVLDLLEPSDA